MSDHLISIVVRLLLISWFSVNLNVARADTLRDDLVKQLEQARAITKSTPDKALEIIKEVIESANEHAYPKLVVQGHLIATTIYKTQGDYYEALRSVDKARNAITDKEKITAITLEIELEHARTLERLGDYKGAAAILKRLSDDAAKVNEYGALLEAQNLLGIIYNRLGNKNLALEQYFSLIKNLKSYGEADYIGSIYNNIAFVYYSHENYIEALRYLKLSENDKAHDSEPYRRQIRKTNFAKILIALNQLDEARLYIDEAKALSGKADVQYSKNLLMQTEADWYMYKEDYTQAEQLMLESLAESKQKQHHDLIILNLKSLIELKERQADYEAALGYLRELSEKNAKAEELSSLNLLHNMEQIFSQSAQQHRVNLLEKEKKVARLKAYGLIFGLVIAFIILYLLRKQVLYRKSLTELTDRYHKFLKDSNISDGLTGLLNRRGMSRAWDEAMKKTSPLNKDMSLAVIGIDNFKEQLQAKGQSAADHAIKHVAQFIKKTIKAPNAAARWIDEHFVIMFAPSADTDVASTLNYIQENLKKYPVIIDDLPMKLELSIGVAQGTGDPYEILDRADHAQFKASNQGDQCVFVSNE